MVQISQEQIKAALLEIMEEKPEYFEAIVKKIIEKKPKESKEDRESKVRSMIEEDFTKYEDVFKKLA